MPAKKKSEEQEKKKPEKSEDIMDGVRDEYPLEAEGMRVTVQIVGGKGQLSRYALVVPQVAAPTSALLDEVRHELITDVNVSTQEILDPKIINSLKHKFSVKAGELIKKKLPNIKDDARQMLLTILMNDMLGLGNIEFLLNDVNLEELVINSANEPVRVYHKKYGWLETNIDLKSEAQILNYSNIIARRIGRQITTLNPLLDAHLITGDRANAVLYPISNKGHTITIRKFARDPWTIVDFIKNGTSSSDILSLIWLAMQYEMNIIISGGTGSGKTSFLNALLPFIPPNQRIISIEDTRELQLPSFLYWCPLVTRQPNPEGKGAITMLDLLINALRMRPDRIILGEMRRQQEAEVLFEAMHTGHSVYATLHADSLAETISRLVNPPLSVPANLLSAVNMNLVMFRDRRKGIRRTFQVGEFLVAEEEGKISAKPNLLYRWKAVSDTLVAHSQSLKLMEDLNRHTGMSQQEITKDLAAKKMILEYLVKFNKRSIEDVGRMMKLYYLDQENVIQAATKNTDPELLFKNA